MRTFCVVCVLVAVVTAKLASDISANENSAKYTKEKLLSENKSLVEADYNSYVDQLLGLASYDILSKGYVDIVDDFGHFEILDAVNNSTILVDWLMSLGSLKGLSNITRTSDVTPRYRNNSGTFFLDFNFALPTLEMQYMYTLRIRDMKYGGFVYTTLKSEGSQLSLVYPNNGTFFFNGLLSTWTRFQLLNGSLWPSFDEYPQAVGPIIDAAVYSLWDTGWLSMHEALDDGTFSATAALGLPEIPYKH